MAQRSSPLLPATERRLHDLGERIRLARLRRRLTARHVAERAGMSPMTLRGIERGGPGVTIGAYAAVLQVLGLEADIDHLATQDAIGRDLQDSRLRQSPARAPAPPAAVQKSKIVPSRQAPSSPPPTLEPAVAASAASRRKASASGVSAQDLAKLIVPAPAPSPASAGRRGRRKT
ncbi:MAG TPA: helix-turn-helix domain-containing protein [Ramlibacter sp.]|uniref:helix-turn-helix domain-containing protein n=1 Tax=Ramlibacter sp. TaxID=1917967 RepID=UPI002C39DC51|nr:helix-turn-helix domain-containing protein [Ramlibacter sp.]HVZ46701.1 helix-turn-helix domain-containing protein [Ramlibacter sp.]